MGWGGEGHDRVVWSGDLGGEARLSVGWSGWLWEVGGLMCSGLDVG